MARHGLNPLRRYWRLTVVWAMAFIIAAGLAATTKSLPTHILEAVAVGTCLWSRLDRSPRTKQRTPHLVLCLNTLAFAAVMIVSAILLVQA